jgi:hypothetical protein
MRGDRKITTAEAATRPAHDAELVSCTPPGSPSRITVGAA